MSPASEPQQTRTGLRARTIGGREIFFDADGFFNDFDDWTEESFLFLAGESGMDDITEEHWRVVRFLREFYAYHGHAPLNQQLRNGTDLSALDMQRLFPGGIKEGARKLAGLPNPKTCS